MYINKNILNTNNGDNMLDALSIVPRSLISLITLFIVTKIIGKKQVSELSLFDYVIGISIGNFTAEMTMDLDGQYINGIIAMVVFGVFAWFISYITMHSIKIRRVIIGVPTVLIQNGKILEKGLRKTMIDINDLLEQCRINGNFDINEIEFAIMEANGKISILPKKEYTPVTIKDMNLKANKVGLCSNVIIDGKVMKKNLENVSKEEKWLLKELKVKGKRLDDILLATMDIDDKLVIYERNKNMTIKNVLE